MKPLKNRQILDFKNSSVSKSKRFSTNIDLQLMPQVVGSARSSSPKTAPLLYILERVVLKKEIII
jgi:hypothetical protein